MVRLLRKFSPLTGKPGFALSSLISSDHNDYDHSGKLQIKDIGRSGGHG